MDKKGKVTLALLLVIIALLSIGVFYLSYKVSTIESSITEIAENSKQKISPIKPVDGKDGVNGTNGLDGIAGKNGLNGKDSASTHTKEIIYTPVPGPQGESGKPADSDTVRVNPATGDLEKKKESDFFWTTMVPCSNLLKVCPGDVVTESASGK